MGLPDADAPSAAAVDVSVLVITYNHAAYVARALESVLAQRTARRVEVIVSEDCSTDGTAQIVRDIAMRHAQMRVLASTANLRSNEVVARAIRAARGAYVCILDGDDFWLDEHKLEAQADILDRSPQLSAVFHNAVLVEGDEITDRRWTPAHQPPTLALGQLCAGNPFATCAGMLRRQALARLGPWYDAFFPITDWPLYILCAEHGAIGFRDEVVGGYRIHDGGLFSALPTGSKLDQIEGFYRRMIRACEPAGRRAARTGRARYFYDWAVSYRDRKDRRMAVDCLVRALRSGGLGAVATPCEVLALARRISRLPSVRAA